MSSAILPSEMWPEETRPDYVPPPALTHTPRPRVYGAGRAAGRYAMSLAVVWIFSIIAAAIWIYGRGLSTLFDSFPRFLQNIGSLLGVIAAVLMMFQVLFMSRFPLFEKGFGRDVIVEVHKKVGFWSFWLILAHALFVIVGYNIADDANPWTSLGVLTWQLRFAILGTLLLFIAVIFLSIRKIKARLSYDAWYWWHLAAYLGAFITVPHQIFLGGSFLGSPVIMHVPGIGSVSLTALFWLGLWTITFGAVVIWRFLVPIVNYFKYDMRVAAVEPDGARGVNLVVTGKNLDRLGTKAGQFFNWRFLDSPGALKANPFSISMPPTNDQLRVAVRVVGDGTERIAQLKPGQRVFVEGPYGRISGDLRTGRRMLMFGAGAGVGPMMSLLADQEWAPGEAILVTRENVEEDTMMEADIQRLVNERGLVWKRLIGEPAPEGSRWLPPTPEGGSYDGAALIRQWVDGDVENVDVFLCGPPIWMTGAQVDIAKAGIPEHQVHVESFAF